MKNKFHSRVTTCDQLIFYRLTQDKQAIHLTFDRERHKRAKIRLHEKSLLILPQSNEIIPTAALQKLLTQQNPFQQFSQTPFIKEGTPFQQQVWELISQIPIGTTQTYGHLAEKLGNKKLARAVGRACNANPLALFIPCHRVIGVSGLGGFAGGVKIKEQLLQIEGANCIWDAILYKILLDDRYF